MRRLALCQMPIKGEFSASDIPRTPYQCMSLLRIIWKVRHSLCSIMMTTLVFDMPNGRKTYMDFCKRVYRATHPRIF